MNWRPVVLAAGVAAGLGAGPARAQSKDDRELLSYVLTMDKVQRLSNAAKGLHELEKRHPEMASEHAGNQSIDAMVRNLQRYPDAVAVLNRNGIPPREYAVGFLTLIQSTMAVGLKRAGTFPSYPPELAAMVSKTNLAFVEQHYAEIKKLLPDWSSEPDEAR